MASTYPSTQDAFGAPASTTPLDSTTLRHSVQHENLGDAIEALQRRLGYSSATAGTGILAPTTSPGDVLHVADTLGHTKWGPRAQVQLAELVATATAASMAFTGIPATYRSLRAVMSARVTATSGQIVRCRFNGDTSTAYASQFFTAISTIMASSRETGATSAALMAVTPATAPALSMAGYEVMWHNYASTAHWKTMYSQGVWDFSTIAAPALPIILQRAAIWNSTAAIASLEFLPETGDFAAGTRISLYGVPGS